MPQKLKGKKLSDKEHEIWKSAYESCENDPKCDDPGAVATAAVKKHRRKKGGSKSKKLSKVK